MNDNIEKKGNNPIIKYYQIPIKSKIQKNKNGKVYDIRERSFQFAQRILNIINMVPKLKILESIRIQLLKSGTSIGANIEEADGTISKRDFINKLVIARKEAKETKFWLKLISTKYVEKEELEEDIVEVQELINILSSIINKTKAKT
jgi:four helix bundle protein